MLIESRYNRLMSMYWKALYTAMDESRETHPSEAVLEACRVCKKVIEKEIEDCGYQSHAMHTHPKD